MDKIALFLLGLCIVLYYLYTSAKRQRASVEYELKKEAYKKEFDEAVGKQQLAKEEYEAALAHYVNIRAQYDKLLEGRRSESDS